MTAGSARAATAATFGFAPVRTLMRDTPGNVAAATHMRTDVLIAHKSGAEMRD